MKDFYLGLDVGGTKCAVILGRCGETMEIIDRIAFPTEAKKGFDHTIENIYAAIDEMMARHSLSADNVQALGISCGGPLNSKTGRVLSPPNLFGWDDIPIVELMETRYGISTALQNDANACALAEWRFGAARGFENVIFCTFGTGMAGEIGHLRLSEHGPVGFGKEGSFEGFCSGGGIAQLARTKVLQALPMGVRPSFCPDVQLLDTLSAKSVAEAAHAGDELAKSIYRECGFYLGRGLSLLIDIINPEVIVLGSIYERSGDLLEQAAMEVISQEAIAASAACCRIVGAKLGDQIGDYAALSVAYEKGLKL